MPGLAGAAEALAAKAKLESAATAGEHHTNAAHRDGQEVIAADSKTTIADGNTGKDGAKGKDSGDAYRVTIGGKPAANKDDKPAPSDLSTSSSQTKKPTLADLMSSARKASQESENGAIKHDAENAPVSKDTSKTMFDLVSALKASTSEGKKPINNGEDNGDDSKPNLKIGTNGITEDTNGKMFSSDFVNLSARAAANAIFATRAFKRVIPSRLKTQDALVDEELQTVYRDYLSSRSAGSPNLKKLRAAGQAIMNAQKLLQRSGLGSAKFEPLPQDDDIYTFDSRTVGEMFGDTSHIPLALLVPLNKLDGFSATMEHRIDSFKPIIEKVIYWENIKLSTWLISGVITAWLFARYRFSIYWLFVIISYVGFAFKRNQKRLVRKINDHASREAALNKLDTDNETVEWMNLFVAKFWLMFEPSLSQQIKDQANDTLAQVKPGFLDDLSLTVFTLGSQAPRVDAVKSYNGLGDDTVVMDWHVSFSPLEDTTIKESSAYDLRNSKIELTARVGKGPASIPLPVLVEELGFRGKARIQLKLSTKFPHIKTVEFCLTERPFIDFIVRPLKSVDLMDTPGLSAFISDTINSNLDAILIDPHKITIDVEAIMTGSANEEEPLGVLQVHFSEARNLKNLELTGKSDPYCRVHVGNEIVLRSKTIDNNLNPSWEETLYFIVRKKHLSHAANDSDSLYVEVMDYNNLSKDKSMGRTEGLSLSKWLFFSLIEGESDTKSAKKKSMRPSTTALSDNGEDIENEDDDNDNDNDNEDGEGEEDGASAMAVPIEEEEAREKNPLYDLVDKNMTMEEKSDILREWGAPLVSEPIPPWRSLIPSNVAAANLTKNSSEKKDLGDLKVDYAFFPMRPKDQCLDIVAATAAAAESNEGPVTMEDHITGILEITIGQAKELPGGKTNPYATVEMGGDRIISTEIKRKTQNPIWDHKEQVFVKDVTEAKLSITVYNNDRVLGNVLVEPEKVLTQVKPQEWYSLTINGKSTTGRIKLGFKWADVQLEVNDNSLAQVYRRYKGLLKVTVSGARDVHNVELMGKSDPYCRLKFGGKPFGTTQIKNGTLNPVWNEIFYAPVYETSDKLTISLWDWNNIRKDRPLGTVLFTADELLTDPEIMEKSTNVSRHYARALKDGLVVKARDDSIKVIAPIYMKKKDEKEPKSAKSGKKLVVDSPADTPLDSAAPTTGPLSPFSVSSIQSVGSNITGTLSGTLSEIKSLPSSIPIVNQVPGLGGNELKQKGFLNFTVSYIPIVHDSLILAATEKQIKERMIKQLEDAVSLKDPNSSVSKTGNKADLPSNAAVTLDEEKQPLLGEEALLLDNKEFEFIWTPEEVKNIVERNPNGIVKIFMHNCIKLSCSGPLYLELLADDFSLWKSRVRRTGRSPNWNQVFDTFLTDIDTKTITILVKYCAEKSPSDDDIVVGHWTGSLVEDIIGKQGAILPLLDGPVDSLAKGVVGFIGDLRISASYSPVVNSDLVEDVRSSSGTLFVDVIEAINLEAVDSSGTSDPFVIVEMEGKKIFQSATLKKTLSPEWHESFVTRVDSKQRAIIDFTIKDWNQFSKNVVLGTYSLYLGSITNNEAIIIESFLDGATQGVIRLKVLFIADNFAHRLAAHMPGIANGDKENGLKFFGAGTQRVVSPEDINALSKMGSGIVASGADVGNMVVGGVGKVLTEGAGIATSPAALLSNVTGIQIGLGPGGKNKKEKEKLPSTDEIAEKLNLRTSKDNPNNISIEASMGLEKLRSFNGSTQTINLSNSSLAALSADGDGGGIRTADSGMSRGSLASYSSMQPQLKVRITVIEAENLKAVDTTDTSDPYVKLLQNLHGKSRVLLKTAYIKKSLHPIWDQEKETVVVTVPPSKLFVQVKDYNVLHKSVNIGSVLIDVVELLRDTSIHEGWFKLTSGTGSVKLRFEIIDIKEVPIGTPLLSNATSTQSIIDSDDEHDKTSRRASVSSFFKGK